MKVKKVKLVEKNDNEPFYGLPLLDPRGEIFQVFSLIRIIVFVHFSYGSFTSSSLFIFVYSLYFSFCCFSTFLLLSERRIAVRIRSISDKRIRTEKGRVCVCDIEWLLCTHDLFTLYCSYLHDRSLFFSSRVFHFQ